VEKISNKRAVIGAGKTGLSCARFLRDRGESFIWCDTREVPPGISEIRDAFPDVEIYCGELDEAVLCKTSEIIVSPGVSVMEPALRAAAEVGVPLVGDIELFARATKKPVIAITGSNAKSTVTTLVGDMAVACGLRAAVGGNLGTPVLDMLAADAANDCYVLELSSFQLETTCSLRAEVAAILNISEDHMDRYNSLEDYTHAKHRIYNNAKHVVFNRADSLTYPQSTVSGKQISFGLDESDADSVGIIEVDGQHWLACGKENRLLCVEDIRIAGTHNLSNVAAAFAIAVAAGWNTAGCVKAVKAFTGLPHRCQWVAERHGVQFFNDSKGTNIGATVAAIEGLGKGRNIVLIAGGDSKGADFSQLAPMVRQHVRHLVLIGRDADKIAHACEGVQQIRADSMADAVQKSQKIAAQDDVVLLSPACASFDMFDGYDDRGRQFCAAVEALT
jgi:UDP-N-acetylmuramoylalanine--D-glutamate ligase